MQYWVYIWAYQYGAYRDSETLVFGATAFDALLTAMQQKQLTFVNEAIVVSVGAFQGEIFHDVPLVPVQEVH